MKRRTRIVPSLVMTATFVSVSVIPACGGAITSDDGGSDGSNDVILKGVADVGFGVGAVAFCCFDSGVADAGFIPDAPADAPKGG